MDNEGSDVNMTESTVESSSDVEQTSQEDTSISAEEQSNTQVSEGDETTAMESEEKMIPYSRFQEKVQEFNDMKEQMAELKAKAEMADRVQGAVNQEPMTPEEAARQRRLEAARQELEAMGYVDKTTVDQLVEEKINAYKWQERYVSQMQKLADKYDDFDPEKVASWQDKQAQQGNHITDPEVAYKMMNLDKLSESKAKAQKSSAYSEKPGGPVHAETDKRKADLAAAAKTGQYSDFLKKHINIPDN